MLGDREQWEARRKQSHDDRVIAQMRSGYKRLRAIPDWLKVLLSRGPVLLSDVRRAGKDAGLRWHRDHHFAERSIREAAAKLAITGLYEKAAGSSGS